VLLVENPVPAAARLGFGQGGAGYGADPVPCRYRAVLTLGKILGLNDRLPSDWRPLVRVFVG
jgi:hypothetical protein